MKASNRPILPPRKAEHLVTLAAALLVLIGGLIAVAAWRKNDTNASSSQPMTAPSPTPPPGTLSGMTILVDPGHGGYDGGARCRDSGVWEKEINLAVALALERELSARGAAVVMTRRADVDLCEENRPAHLTKKRQDMQNRVRLATENQADMVLSIHMNEYRVRSQSGPQVFYRAGCDAGRLLAGCVQQAMIRQLQPKKERTAMAGDYFILQLEVASVLVECGFVSNAEEEKRLLEAVYQQQIAQAIAIGVEEYCRLAPPQGKDPAAQTQ
ncbi:MAG: N-acetylmuramoyl-L-alanine amidase [Aristaeellaceae bacterium]